MTMRMLLSLVSASYDVSACKQKGATNLQNATKINHNQQLYSLKKHSGCTFVFYANRCFSFFCVKGYHCPCPLMLKSLSYDDGGRPCAINQKGKRISGIQWGKIRFCNNGFFSII
jgi:hypothetical protein